jgi:hypothetical protein
MLPVTILSKHSIFQICELEANTACNLRVIICMKVSSGQDFKVSKVTGYKLNSLGFIPDRAGIFSSLPHPDWLWDPPNFLSFGLWGLFFLLKGMWP